MQLIKKLLPASFKNEVKEKLGVPSLQWSLKNLKRCGFSPKFVIDGGAYVGQWTEEFLNVFPESKVLMIEAQESRETELRKISGAKPNVDYVIGLLGANDGAEVNFIQNETISYATEIETQNSMKRKMKSLDKIVQEKDGGFPDFLKLDVQGFELQVLMGAQECLKRLEVCLLEVSVFDWGVSKVPFIPEVLSFMNDRDFIVYDIASITRRPLDQVLNQVDLLFVRRDSKLVADKRWSL